MSEKTPITPWKTISSREVFKADHWFTVVRDTVRLPSGRMVDDYFRIEAPDYVLIYAKSDDHKVLVERQYKHGLGKITTTFPAGFIDKGEQPLEAAKRELLEETGFVAKSWKRLGTFTLDGTRNYGRAHYFLAEHLEKCAEPLQCDMEELSISFLTMDELLSEIARGELCLLPGISILAIASNPLFQNIFTSIE